MRRPCSILKECGPNYIGFLMIICLIQISTEVSSFSTGTAAQFLSSLRSNAPSAHELPTVENSVAATYGGFTSLLLRRDVLKAVWRNSVVSLTIPASKERTYDLFSSLDEHPTWSPWLEKVDFDRGSRISKWTLKSLGLTISWNANNTIMDSPNVVQWESLNGFPNKGRVQFSDDCDMKLVGIDSDGYEIYEEVDECSIVPESTLLTLTISYDLPPAGVILLESLGPKGQEFIQQTLLGDLKRFRERLVRDLKEERMASFRESQIGRNSNKKVKEIVE